MMSPGAGPTSNSAHLLIPHLQNQIGKAHVVSSSDKVTVARETGVKLRHVHAGAAAVSGVVLH